MRAGFLRPSLPLLVLPVLHLALCIVVQFTSSEGGWAWFPIYLVDLPFSYVLLFVGRFVPSGFVVFGILGTLWWYFISVFVRWFFRMIQQRGFSQ
jgi:hypothetical protein